MNYQDFEISIVNPRETKKMAKHKTPPRNKKGQFKKGGKSSSGGSSSSKSRESNPRKGSRKSGSRKGKRRPPRRRANPRGEREGFRAQGMWPLNRGNMDLVAPAVMNKLLVALVVKKWGSDKGGLLGPGESSDFVGRSWTFRDYGLAFLASFAGAKVVASRMGKNWGDMFWLTGVSDMAARLLWTEGIARSDSLQKWFGQYDDAAGMAALRDMRGVQPGAVLETPGGRYMLDNADGWTAMQGIVTTASRYDGVPVTANRYDGVVQASAYDGFGHAIDTPSPQARYQRTGAADPYASVYLPAA